MTLELRQFKLPSYWAPYLINNDHSGLDDTERARVDAWVDHCVATYGSCHIHDAEDLGFCHGSLDCNELAGDYCLFSMLVDESRN